MPAFRVFSVLFLAILTVSPASAQTPAPIRIDQAGYYLNGPKLASWVSTEPARNFRLVSLPSGKTVFTGKSSGPVASGNSSLKVHTLDFTTLKKAGRYRIMFEGGDSSYPFNISVSPHHDAAVAALKGFYFQRMSTTLSPVYAGKWARPFAHPDEHVLVHASAATEKRPEGTVISSPGGWYDAGDYNKYIVNSGITMGTLMSAYEDFPAYFSKTRIGIPETDNALPDILDEVLWNLRWMLTMQDPNDGGVYHKCTNAAFDPMVMPSACTRNRYVVAKSTAAALDFAAVMAQAGRLFEAYEKQLPKLYDSCMRASRMAWNWAMKNPNVIYDQDGMNKKFSPAITTGAYGDGHLDDEWFWAAAELTASTGQDKYAKVVEAHMDLPLSLPSWNSVAMMGYHTLIREEKIFSPWIRVITKELRARTIRFADSLLNNAAHNAFRTPMGGSPKDFVWGSSGVAANQGMLLIQAAAISGNRKYLDGAIANADHLLGRNATGYCFLTGTGSFSTRHPHHRLSIADGIDDPVPGLLSGGPNPGKQDGCNYACSEAETTYLDEDCSYASNEIAINWNAPLVYLLFGIEVLQ